MHGNLSEYLVESIENTLTIDSRLSALSAGIIYLRLSRRFQDSIPTFSPSRPVLGCVSLFPLTSMPGDPRPFFLVVHRDALFDDRDKDISVHSFD